MIERGESREDKRRWEKRKRVKKRQGRAEMRQREGHRI